LIVLGIVSLISWWLLRSFVLTIHQLNNSVLLYNRSEKPLKAIYEKIIELKADKRKLPPKEPGGVC